MAGAPEAYHTHPSHTPRHLSACRDCTHSPSKVEDHALQTDRILTAGVGSQIVAGVRGMEAVFRGIFHHESWVAGDHTLEGDVGSRAYNPAGVENEGGMEGDHDRSIDHHKEEGREADAENAPAPVGMAAVLVHLPSFQSLLLSLAQ